MTSILRSLDIVAVPAVLGLAVVGVVMLSSARYETTAIVTPGINSLIEMRESASFRDGLAWEMGAGAGAATEDYTARITLVPLSFKDRTAIYITGPDEAQTARLTDAVMRQMTLFFTPSARRRAAISAEFQRIDSILPGYRQAMERASGTVDGVTRSIAGGETVETDALFNAVQEIGYWIDLAENVDVMSRYRSRVTADLLGFDQSNIVQKPSAPQWRRSVDAAVTMGSSTAIIAFLAMLYGRSFRRGPPREGASEVS